MSVLADSYAIANRDDNVYFTLFSQCAQTFTGNGGVLESAKFGLKDAYPAKNAEDFYLEIYAISGTYGSTSVPTGSPLATSEPVYQASIPTLTGMFVQFTFSGANQITLTNGTKYALVIRPSSAISGRNTIYFDNSSPTHSGNFSYYNGSWNAVSTRDFVFEVYTQNVSVNTNSSRSAIITGKSSSNAARNSVISGGATTENQRQAIIVGKADDYYFKENSNQLEVLDTQLTSIFTEDEYTKASIDDNDYVNLIGKETYNKYLFKVYNVLETTLGFTITWKGKSTKSASVSSVYLQVFNHSTNEWETLDVESFAEANTEFTLTGVKTENREDYYDEYYIISCRVYQEI